jgi:exoribonuclease-2
MLLAPRRGQLFDGVVTGASNKGTWVRIQHPLAEGRLQRGYDGLEVGDRVRVRLVHTDPSRGFIDFDRA